MDDVAISPAEGFLVRKGPGNCHFDFAQEILFVDYLLSPTDNRSAGNSPKYREQFKSLHLHVRNEKKKISY